MLEGCEPLDNAGNYPIGDDEKQVEALLAHMALLRENPGFKLEVADDDETLPRPPVLASRAYMPRAAYPLHLMANEALQPAWEPSMFE